MSVAVHELSSGGAAPPLLISHATGFCGHAYAPLAAALGDRFRSLAIDHRGHGATMPPPGWEVGEGVDWRRFGDDTLAVARAIDAPGRLVGFGHSMGGSSLLMAAHRDPSLFARLVLFEPIARPPADQPVDARRVADRARRPPPQAPVPVVPGGVRELPAQAAAVGR